MSEAIVEQTAGELEAVTPAASPTEAEMVEAATFYASIASVLDEMGFDPAEAREAMYDILAAIARRVEASYVQGIAEIAARKKRHAYAIVSAYDEYYFASLLNYIVSGACNEANLEDAIIDVAGAVGLEPAAADALLTMLRGKSCSDMRYALLALLLVPPAPGAEKA